MKIKKNSWHYKLYSKMGGEYDTTGNLCPYFWAVVFRLFVLLMIACVLGAMLYMLGDVVRMVAHQMGWWGLLIPGGIAAVFGLSCLLFIALPNSDTGKLVGAFIKAKTKGICPTVEFTDEK